MSSPLLCKLCELNRSELWSTIEPHNVCDSVLQKVCRDAAITWVVVVLHVKA